MTYPATATKAKTLRYTITEPNDSRIEVYLGLRDHVLRRRRERPGGDMAGVFVAEGDIVIERALRAGYELESILIDGRRTKDLPDAVDPATPIYACAENVLQQITGYHLHRGALACFRRKPLLSVDEVLDGATTIAVMENLNNPTNLGVILRCAVALGVDGYFLDDSCCDPLYRRCGRVSMGEAYATPYARLGRFPEGLDSLRDAGFALLALTPDPEAEPINGLRFGRGDKVALLLGAEGPGLTDETLAAASRRVRIPMAGQVDSINVGSAAAVAFYALGQARKDLG